MNRYPAPPQVAEVDLPQFRLFCHPSLQTLQLCLVPNASESLRNHARQRSLKSIPSCRTVCSSLKEPICPEPRSICQDCQTLRVLEEILSCLMEEMKVIS